MVFQQNNFSLTAFRFWFRVKPAGEVYVTGTFDQWSRSVRLEKTEEGFEKEVELPTNEDKILYKVHCSLIN